MRDLPTGTVTFLFTDIEGSTALLQRLGGEYDAAEAQHAEVLRKAITDDGGVEVRTEGDSFFAVFPTPAAAVRAAVAAQRGLAHQRWPDGVTLRVRMGMHTGEGKTGGSQPGADYVGIDVNRAARIAAAAHGGQVLLSGATRGLVENDLPHDVAVRDLGMHRLKDLEYPEHLHDLVIAGLPADFPPPKSLGVRPTNLPPQRTLFVGRKREIAEITDLLGVSRLVTLTGPGGTGKTRLALRVATDHLDRFEDGVFLVDLSAVIDPAVVPSEIAVTLGVRDLSRDVFHALVDYLRNREFLLVLDNLEQLLEATPRVGELLDAAPRLRILATSRGALRLSGEHEYHLGPLPLPGPEELKDLDRLSTCDSVLLFVERAAAVRPGFRLTPETSSAIAEISARVDGLPLALELAATRVNVLTPQALAERLSQRLALLTGGARDLPERQRTLRETIQWSHDLLHPKEQRLFAHLAVFAGGWSLEAAEATCGVDLDLGVLDGLSALADASLVRRQEAVNGDVRFRMLETIREYALERLAASGEEDQIRRRHAIFFRDLAEGAEPHLTGVGQARWLSVLDTEHDNLRSALDWAQRAGDLETALRTASAMWRFWHQRGHLAEGRARLDRLMGLPPAQRRDALRAKALHAQGGIVYWQGDYEQMGEIYEEAVDIAREVGDRKLLARALFDLSFVSLLERDLDGNESILRETLALATGHDPFLSAQSWAGLGYVEAFRGNVAAGIEHLQRGIAILRDLGERLFLCESLVGLSIAELITANLEGARAHFQEAASIATDVRAPAAIENVIYSNAFFANHEGRHGRAALLLGASARLREDLGAPLPYFLRMLFGDPEDRARAALGEKAFEAAWAEGYALSIDDILNQAEP